MNEVRKYFVFMIWQKSKLYFLLFFCSDFGKVIFWKNIMVSKYYFIWNQKYFSKYDFKKRNSQYYSILLTWYDASFVTPSVTSLVTLLVTVLSALLVTSFVKGFKFLNLGQSSVCPLPLKNPFAGIFRRKSLFDDLKN